MGQTSYYYVYGGYTVQKAVILHDFDHWRVGLLAPNSPLNQFFEIQGKQLVPRPDFDYSLFIRSQPGYAKELRNQEDSPSKAPLEPLMAPRRSVAI